MVITCLFFISIYGGGRYGLGSDRTRAGPEAAREDDIALESRYLGGAPGTTVGLYTLKSLVAHSLKAPGFNP